MSSEAEFSLARILRPDVIAVTNRYQGKSTNVPIAFPGTLDPMVGQTNINSSLMAGYPVPFGSKVMLWLPMFLIAESFQADFKLLSYAWRVVWRLRNVEAYQAYQQSGKNPAGYRFPGTMPGQLPTGSIIPAVTDSGQAISSVAAPPFDPTNILQVGQKVTVPENWFMPRGTVLGDQSGNASVDLSPLYADGSTAELSQGAIKGPQGNVTTMVQWGLVQLTALGDDMILLLNNTTPRTWDFTDSTKDKILLDNLNNNPDFGAYLITGTGGVAPAQTPATTA